MKKIQTQLDKLSNLCLEEDTYQKYSDDDLMNATLVFSHILLDIIYSESQHLSFTKQVKLAEKTGEAIRYLILSCTGKDMHKIAK